MAKCEVVEFEAWAVQRDKGELIAYDSPGAGPLLLSCEDDAERQTSIDAAFGVGSAAVRVHVRVSVLEARGEKGEG